VASFRPPFFPILYSDDPSSAVAFYRDLLGFSETFRFPEDGEADFVALKLDGAELAIGRAGDPLHGKPVRPASGHRFELCVYTDDVDSAVTKLREAGVPVLVEPADQPWNERLAYVEDPDGNPVMITAPVD
jgi:lactoylglutathione lyase